nr:MAG TPA: hypothetical protein [Caudoviricetes sp.]
MKMGLRRFGRNLTIQTPSPHLNKYVVKHK